MILPRLRGAAGPNPDPNDYDCEPDTELISIPAVPKYRDPLHIILQYIAEAAPNCDMVIVHDDDLALLDGLGYGTSREALQPDVELSYLRSSKPLIHEVLFGSDELLPDNNSPVADAEAIRVATLSAIYQKQCRTSDSIKGRMISANDLRCPPDPTYVVSSRDLERPHPQVHPLPLSTPVLPRPRYDVSRRRQAHKPHALALRPYSDTTPSVSETSIDELDRHSLHRFTPPTSPIYATPLSAYGHAKTDIDHIKSPDDISNQLAVLEQLRRNVQKNIRLRTVPISPSPPPRSPPQPLSPTLEIPRGPSFSIDPTSVTSRLDNPIRRPLLIDTRPTAAFLGSHIKSSINFYIPSLILKRSRKPGAGFGSIDALRQFITTEPCRLAWDTLMAPGGPWDGDAIVYDEEMNPLDRLNPQVTAWALLPLIMLLVRGRAGYLEGGMLAARAHPSLQKFITSSDNSSLNAPNMVQEKFFPTPRAPKLLFPPKPIKGWNLFQSDTATAARSGIPPEIEPSEGASPVAMPTNILPGNTDSSPWNIIGASPSLPPSRSAFPRPSPPRRPSLTTLRRLDTKSAERLGPPKLQLRTLRSAIPGSHTRSLQPYTTNSLSKVSLVPTKHTFPHYFPPPPNPFTTRPDLSAPPSTEEAIPTFTVSTILPNFLYLGPEITTEEDVRELESLGITKRFERYVKIPMRDTVEEENIIRNVREACEVLDDASLHSAPTYVHCKAGNSRSMTAVMAYLIHANHWTLSRAYTFLINFEEAEFGVVKRPQSAGGADDGEHPDGDAHNRGAAIGIGISGRRPSHMRESLPPAWGTSTTSSLPGTARGVTGDVGQEVEVKDVNRRYRHARRAPVDEDTPQPILMRRVGKAGLENTFIDSMHPRID
ncbi:hypothetical protein BJY52DRAFT_1211681 [Lactarius psammicola]|nr:hypothetical protein BJY52DRAFT_1211681 [Lactarius psammicola]